MLRLQTLGRAAGESHHHARTTSERIGCIEMNFLTWLQIERILDETADCSWMSLPGRGRPWWDRSTLKVCRMSVLGMFRFGWRFRALLVP